MDKQDALEILGEFWEANRNLHFALPWPHQELDGHWVRHQSGLPWLQIHLPVEIDWNRVLEEAQSLDDLYVSHRAKGGHSGWSSLVIHGLGQNMTQNYEQYGYDEEPFHLYGWTEICDRIPYTVKVFKELFPYKAYSRIRFMRLDPGGYILPHDDDDVRRLGPVNISLNQPVGCEFLQKNQGLVPFKDGTLFNLDISQEHSVWNRSEESRYHIIVHGEPNETWDSVLVNSFLKRRQEVPPQKKRGIEISNEKSALGDYIRHNPVFLTHSHVPLAKSFNWLSSQCTSEVKKKIRAELENNPDSQLTRVDLDRIKLIRIEPGEKTFLKGQRNSIYFLAFEKPELQAVEWIQNGEINKTFPQFGELFFVKDGQPIANYGASPVLAVQIDPPYSVSPEFLDVIHKNPGDLLLAAAREDKDLDIKDLRAWLESGFRQSTLENIGFSLIMVDDPTIPEEQRTELIEKVFRPSLEPIPFTLVAPEQLNEALIEISRSKEGAVVVSPGVYIKNVPGFAYETTRLLSQLKKQGLPLAGQIMDWGGERLPYLHEQMAVINLDKWKKYSEIPLLESEEEIRFPGYLASSQKFHDHYTPFFIEPADEAPKKGRPRWGARLMAAIVGDGLRVVNLPTDLRGQKTFSYPKDPLNIQEFKILTELIDKAERNRNCLYYFNNSESNLNYVKPFAPEHIVSVAAGLRHLIGANMFGSKKVTLVDVSVRALEFWKTFHRLRTEIQLENLLEAFAGYERIDANELKRKMRDTIRRYFGSFHAMKELMSGLDFKYLCLDFVKNPEALPKIFDRNRRALFLMSNCYEFAPLFTHMTQEEVDTQFSLMLSNLAAHYRGHSQKSEKGRHFKIYDDEGRCMVAGIDEHIRRFFDTKDLEQSHPSSELQ